MQRILHLLLFVLIGLNVCGQDKNNNETSPEILINDFVLCYRVGTSNLVEDVMNDFVDWVFSLDNYDFANYTFTHGIFVIYKKSVLPRLNPGFAFGFERISKDAYLDDEFRYHLKRRYYTLAPEVEIKYIRREKVQMYSGIGLGLTANRDKLDF